MGIVFDRRSCDLFPEVKLKNHTDSNDWFLLVMGQTAMHLNRFC